MVGNNHISGTAKATVVKFGIYVGYVKSQQKNDKSFWKGAWSGRGHVTHVKFWGSQRYLWNEQS